MSNRRTGKIARLPKEWRDVVNLMLRDGATYQQVIEKLGDHGKDINEQNVTNWKEGGYQDWLTDMERIETLSVRRDAALQMVKELKKDGELHITEANELMLAAQLNEVLSDYDPQILKELMADKPEKFFQLAMSVNSQTSERTKREKLELEVKKYQESVTAARVELQKLRDPKQKLTDEEARVITDKIDELLGVK